MTTVACVLRSGGRYDESWVDRLRNGLARHAAWDHELVVLTDMELERHRAVPLRHGWRGWWSKAELFRPDLFTKRVVYFDLDVLITGSVYLLLTYAGPFLAVKDHWRPGTQSSCVMAWDGADPPPIYEAAVRDGMPMRGRFDLWWNEVARAREIQDEFTGLVGSYKAHQLQAGPQHYAVVDFHGSPKPAEADGWPAALWEERAP